ncbi:hypothetical protein M433DRAFT_174550, partial [Acidomyces richmondensis BFW]
MAADFWAGYLSGAIGILVGNPLDIIKTQLQACGSKPSLFSPDVISPETSTVRMEKPLRKLTSFARGSSAPILGYGALNALLFMTYNRSLALLDTGTISEHPVRPSAWSIWTAGALGGVATFVVSAPTELVKCRAQVSNPPRSSFDIARALWQNGGVRGLYVGGGVTSVRDAVGYGFYFWSYELSKRALISPGSESDETFKQQAIVVLLCGGLAGVATWASIFPLDVIKTRVQTWDLSAARHTSPVAATYPPLLTGQGGSCSTHHKPLIRPSTYQIVREAYTTEGISIFFKGLGVCSVRAFLVNAVQW